MCLPARFQSFSLPPATPISTIVSYRFNEKEEPLPVLARIDAPFRASPGEKEEQGQRGKKKRRKRKKGKRG